MTSPLLHPSPPPPSRPAVVVGGRTLGSSACPLSTTLTSPHRTALHAVSPPAGAQVHPVPMAQAHTCKGSGVLQHPSENGTYKSRHCTGRRLQPPPFCVQVRHREPCPPRSTSHVQHHRHHCQHTPLMALRGPSRLTSEEPTVGNGQGAGFGQRASAALSQDQQWVDVCAHGGVGFSLAGAGGSIEPPETGGFGKRAQLTGPLISYYELWRRRRRCFS